MTAPFDGPVFGAAPLGVACHPRRAAYVVISRPDGRVAAIRASLKDGTRRYWLPGGGMEANESAADTVMREVKEELGRSVSVHAEVGSAVQYFYAGAEDLWYEMKATFLRGVLDDGPVESGEYDLQWVDAREDAGLFFHECHAWAASRVQGVGEA